VVICLERGADLHMAQLMPLSLTVSCFSIIQIGLPFWYRLTWVVPDKGPLKMAVCVCSWTIAAQDNAAHQRLLATCMQDHDHDERRTLLLTASAGLTTWGAMFLAGVRR